MRKLLAVIAVGVFAAQGSAQSVASMSPTTKGFVTVSEPVVALTNVTVFDGTGAAAKPNQTIIIRAGKIPGPHIFLTAPYITGSGSNGSTDMAVITSPEAARRFVAYWAQEGATWIKAYTDIKRADLKAAIDEAHKRGLKVTGHLCSVSFQEAVDLGIDNLEHGFMTNTDFDS